jgi:hypothetical protein
MVSHRGNDLALHRLGNKHHGVRKQVRAAVADGAHQPVQAGVALKLLPQPLGVECAAEAVAVERLS